ncbi:hypothetical protein GSY71_12660 [Pusillimonas sp. TS35]|uniref:gamma-glutamyltransferase n=1 Tax=Paracandidimonas lactea TaxID=2895524 RepID=UPI00136FDD30|nr:gamma-glutamyltransferase [Paracandidimonas lactea]MYN13990.1 hypothetical protein [Pusillimonas sp. TS35]
MKSRQVITRTAAYGTRGAIATARELSAAAAAGMLAAGGNAMDAAVAAAFVAGVIEPMETTLAGSGFLLVGLPDGAAHSVEFGPRAPMAARPGMFTIDENRVVDLGLGVSVVVGDENIQGARSAGVPATIAGLIRAHDCFGKLPLKTVMGPAIAAAFDGFAADSYFALEALEHIDVLRRDPGAAALFLPGGLPPASAHLGRATLGVPALIRQAALGKTLEQIAEQGAAAFYGGELGDAFLQSHRERGGILAREDLLAVNPVIASPRRLRLRDCEVLAPCAPCGALTELQILNTWQALFPEVPRGGDETGRLDMLAQASWHAFADRYHWLGDPDFVPVPEAALLSDAYARELAALIRAGAVPPRSAGSGEMPWNYFARKPAHDPWRYDDCGRDGVVWSPEGATTPPAGTTHISVADTSGMCVAITHTAANHCGAKVVCERTGLLFDAAMGWFNARQGAANSIEGGKRPLANMGPVLLMRGGRPLAAVGAPGGRRIINAVVQVVLNLVERGMTPDEALQAPRIDASGNTLLASERLEQAILPLRSQYGNAALVSEQHEGYGYELARPIIAVLDGGVAYAAADPFSRGYAQGIS